MAKRNIVELFPPEFMAQTDPETDKFLSWFREASTPSNWHPHPIVAVVPLLFKLRSEGWPADIGRPLVEVGLQREGIKFSPVLRTGGWGYFARLIQIIEPDLQAIITTKHTYNPDLDAFGLTDYIPLGNRGWAVSMLTPEELFNETKSQLGNGHAIYGLVRPTAGTFDFERDGDELLARFSRVLLDMGAEIRQHPAPAWRGKFRGETPLVFYRASYRGKQYLQGGTTKGEAVLRLWLNLAR